MFGCCNTCPNIVSITSAQSWDPTANGGAGATITNVFGLNLNDGKVYAWIWDTKTWQVYGAS